MLLLQIKWSPMSLASYRPDWLIERSSETSDQQSEMRMFFFESSLSRYLVL